jgi:hypothetical protein
MGDKTAKDGPLFHFPLSPQGQIGSDRPKMAGQSGKCRKKMVPGGQKRTIRHLVQTHFYKSSFFKK